MIVLNGLGATDRAAAASFCGQRFGVQSHDFQPCVEFYVAGKPGDYTPIASATGGGEPWWQSALMAVTQGATKAITGDGPPMAAGGMPLRPMVAEQPWYMTPTGMIGIGVGVLGLIVLMRK